MAKCVIVTRVRARRVPLRVGELGELEEVFGINNKPIIILLLPITPTIKITFFIEGI